MDGNLTVKYYPMLEDAMGIITYIPFQPGEVMKQDLRMLKDLMMVRITHLTGSISILIPADQAPCKYGG